MAQSFTEIDLSWESGHFSGPGVLIRPSAGDTEQPVTHQTDHAVYQAERAGEQSRAEVVGVQATTAEDSKDVLVVDDEPYLCDLISSVLEAEGHKPRTASNGVEALQQIAERRPDLILLDLMMPVMDGWEFLENMHARPEWQDIPVVLITAVYDVKRMQQQTGARAVITKPFDIDQVTEVVRTYSA